MAGSRQLTKYQMLTHYLQQEIRSGKIGFQQQLPTEKSLAETFGVSRITVRQALTLLEQNGYIQKIQGKGSFASWQKSPMQLNILQGFSEEMLQKGLVPSTRLLKINTVAAGESVAAQLACEPDTPIYQVVRLRLADGIAMCIETSHVPIDMCPGLPSKDLESSLYAIFRDTYKHHMKYADQTVEAGIVQNREADILGVAMGSPALFTSRVTYLSSSEPLEYVTSVYRGDLYRITARLEL